MFRWIVLVTCLFAVAIGLAIGVMNPEPVVVNLPGLTFSLPLGSLLMLVFALGLVCGLLVYLMLFHLPSRLRRSRHPSVNEGQLPERNA